MISEHGIDLTGSKYIAARRVDKDGHITAVFLQFRAKHSRGDIVE